MNRISISILKVTCKNIVLVIIMLVGNLDDITRTVVNEA